MAREVGRGEKGKKAGRRSEWERQPERLEVHVWVA